jgi:tetratricopeptide (TPR) repeat protein
MRIPTHLAAAGLALLLAAPALKAQALHDHVPIPPEQLAEADDLYRRAEALLATCDQNQWKEAAELFEQSARLRPCHDPKIFQALFQASKIASYFDDTRKARRLAVEAADHAMHVGDVEHAVEAYLSAAYLAAALGDRDRAVTYAALAEDLAHSPLLGLKAEELQTLVALAFNKGGGGR